MKHRSFGFALVCAVVSPGLPCLWDHDTLAQERARFPSALELITGRFPRHSDEYYRWRLGDRAEAESSPGVFDDLAVAHEKLGHSDVAIALMHEKEARYPGLYTTAANLGTFLVHAGRHAEGVEHIARAIEINPEAHFGREIYQELLVRYLLTRPDGTELQLPLMPKAFADHKVGLNGFWSYVRETMHVEPEAAAEEIERASIGVMGMLRFGNHDSPVLLEALSDLLLADRRNDAKRLAARALLKASYEVDDSVARAAYRAKAVSALLMQTPNPEESRSMKLSEVEAVFLEELRVAEDWFAELAEAEAEWIANGDEVDARFAETYLKLAPNEPGSTPGWGWKLPVLSVLALGSLLAGVLMSRGSHRMQHSRSRTSPDGPRLT